MCFPQEPGAAVCGGSPAPAAASVLQGGHGLCRARGRVTQPEPAVTVPGGTGSVSTSLTSPPQCSALKHGVMAWWGRVLLSPVSLSGDDAERALWFQACACSLFVCWGADLAWKGDGA